MSKRKKWPFPAVYWSEKKKVSQNILYFEDSLYKWIEANEAVIKIRNKLWLYIRYISFEWDFVGLHGNLFLDYFVSQEQYIVCRASETDWKESTNERPELTVFNRVASSKSTPGQGNDIKSDDRSTRSKTANSQNKHKTPCRTIRIDT